MSSNDNRNGNGHTNGDGYHPERRNGDLLGDREPPRNIEAEQGVIGSVMLDNGALALPKVSRLHPADFFRDAHQVIWRRIRTLHNEGRAIDVVLLAEELQRHDELKSIGGDDALAAILDGTPHSANAEYYAEIVLQKSRTRDLIEFSEQTRDLAYRGDRTADELIAGAGDQLAGIETVEDEEASDGGHRPWPDAPAPEVFHGIAGEIVRMIEPHSEADPIAILVQLLVCFGNIIRHKSHWLAEGTPHFTNMFACIVGNSSKARKGTSFDHVRNLMASCDEEWAKERLTTGLTSGEGMIWFVRDTITLQDGKILPGIDDKRALFIESEFGSALRSISRDGNTLSATLRKAWDGAYLASASKNSPARSTNSHISVIAHITCEELHRCLTDTEVANGFANRFLWCCAKRSKFLPDGGQMHRVNFTDAVNALRESIEFARGDSVEFTRDDFLGGTKAMYRDAEARAIWHEVYATLSTPKGAGLLASVTSRAEAQVMRLAALYALLDRTRIIRKEHLLSGLALWKYCEQSAWYVFGDALGDPDADKLLRALIAAGDAGLTQTQIASKVFKKNKSADRIGAIIAVLARGGTIAMVTRPAGTAGGRPAKVWTAVQK